jgi:hypothetical protein
MLCYLGYLCNGWCGHGCGYQEPYDFVVECGCPIHDPNRRWQQILRSVVLWIKPGGDCA